METLTIVYNELWLTIAITGLIGTVTSLLLEMPRNRRAQVTHFFARIYGALFTKDLSISELILLSSSENDRTGFLKEYFGFKRENLLTAIKGISALIVINAGTIVKNHYEISDKAIVKVDDQVLIFITVGLFLINLWFFWRLTRCNQDFKTAVNIYELLT